MKRGIKLKSDNKGITLIALVITIIVLLILAAISIATLTGENGLLTRATESKEQQEISQKREAVTLAISTEIIDELGDRNKVTADKVVNILKSDENNNAITYESKEGANANGFPADIKFPANTTTIGKDIIIEVDENLEVKGDSTQEGGNQGQTGNLPDGIYEEEGLAKEDITPEDVFLYREINEREAAITGLNPEYCYSKKEWQEDNSGYTDTHYEVIYDGQKINRLVIPYEKEINGKMYEITEVTMQAISTYSYRTTSSRYYNIS